MIKQIMNNSSSYFDILSTVQIIKKYALLAKKSFGQNFLTNPELLGKIVKCCDNVKGQNILEIGTGPCGLTTAILKAEPKKLISVDLDKRCVEIAENELLPHFDNLTVLNQDALKLDESKLFNGEKFSIISNLPYNIGTVLLCKWLENLENNNIHQMILLLQKELVDRIIAKNNTKQYGRLSIFSQYCCFVEKMFDIKPTAFIPQPNVISSVVKLTVKKNIDYSIVDKLTKLTQIIFSKRRKTIYNNLSHIANIENILNNLQIDKNIRAENLTVKEFVLLSKNIDVSI